MIVNTMLTSAPSNLPLQTSGENDEEGTLTLDRSQSRSTRISSIFVFSRKRLRSNINPFAIYRLLRRTNINRFSIYRLLRRTNINTFSIYRKL